VSSPQDQVPSGDALPGPPLTGQPAAAGKVSTDDKLPKTYRLSTPIVLWWAWVALAVFSLGDLLVQGHDRAAVTPALVIILITGIVYACALRPRIVADRDALTVHNPLRDYRVPWGAVKGVYLGDSIELECTRPAPKGDKTLYSWAIYSSRRARQRARQKQAGMNRWGMRQGGYGFGRMPRTAYDGRTPGFGQLPAEGQALQEKGMAEHIATDLGQLSEKAKQTGVPVGVVTGSWAWQPLAAILIPAVVLAVTVPLI
jgi:hypothetical protein